MSEVEMLATRVRKLERRFKAVVGALGACLFASVVMLLGWGWPREVEAQQKGWVKAFAAETVMCKNVLIVDDKLNATGSRFGSDKEGASILTVVNKKQTASLTELGVVLNSADGKSTVMLHADEDGPLIGLKADVAGEKGPHLRLMGGESQAYLFADSFGMASGKFERVAMVPGRVELGDEKGKTVFRAPSK